MIVEHLGHVEHKDFAMVRSRNLTLYLERQVKQDISKKGNTVLQNAQEFV